MLIGFGLNLLHNFLFIWRKKHFVSIFLSYILDETNSPSFPEATPSTALPTNTKGESTATPTTSPTNGIGIAI